MKKPIIGITSNIERELDLKNYYRTTVSIDYTKSVALAGGIPIIIPVTGNLEVIREQLSMIDGLILSGGEDIIPTFYGEDFKVGIKGVSPERDNHEMMLFNEFLKTNKPMLGICRGMQLMNVCLNGTLFQDLKYSKEDVVQHVQEFYPDLPTHQVNIKEGNLLYDLFGKSVMSNSFHHQAVNKLGDGLEIIARANDNIVEAIYKKGHPFLYGIQWHPEMMTARGNSKMKKLFELFIEKCR